MAYFPPGSRGEAYGRKIKQFARKAKGQAGRAYDQLRDAYGTAFGTRVLPTAGSRMSDAAASRPRTPPGKSKR